MEDIQTELKKKKERLAELIKSRSKATCSSTYSSKADVDRETEIEELEDEIKALESNV
jgi:polyhydroxyalkanoate synthesis regulator phasin